MSKTDKQALTASLRRLEALIANLDALPDPAAREPAREALDLLLELHGLALVKLVAGIAASGDVALLTRLAEDPYIGAMLLLHGAHPQDADARVRQVLGDLAPRLEAHGARIISVRLIRSSLRLLLSGAADAALRQEIEEIVIDAAPELDEIIFEELTEISAPLTGVSQHV
jgi:hypothetical protein